MRIQKIVLFGALVIGVAMTVNAQDYAFKVLATKGNNEIKSGGTWQPLKTGASIKKGEEVRLGANAYIGLVHTTGKPVEVKEAGVYPVSDLEARITAGTSVLHKYTDFILSSNDENRNSMNATGAVHRDINSSAITLRLPDNQRSGIFNDVAIINWDAGDTKGPFVITLKNMFEDVLLQEETSENSYKVDLGAAKFKEENAILVEVASKENPRKASRPYVIKKLTPSEQEKIAAAMKEVAPEVSEPTPLNQLILAGFYEQHNLLIDAIAAYEQAITLAPDVPSFRESYDAFLQRNNIR